MPNRTAAVVTTYNRLDWLKKNIDALLHQSYPDLDIIIIDNASTDGTGEYVENIHSARITYQNTGKNLGGAGGFSVGVETALGKGYSFLWLMDDDAVPEADALEKLMDAADAMNHEFSFLCTTVYWSDGSIFPMNVPFLMDLHETGREQIHLMSENHVLPVRACSFVGCFVNAEYAKRIHLPIAEYFIYGDDIEYTMSLSEEQNAYWVLNSVIVHYAPTKAGADLIHVSPERIRRLGYRVRNEVHLYRTHGEVKKYLRFLCSEFIRIIQYSKGKKLLRCATLLKGLIRGIFFHPQLRYVKNSQILENTEKSLTHKR